MKKRFFVIATAVCLSLSVVSCAVKVPPGQVKKTTAPGQLKKATGSQSAKPFAPGQQNSNGNGKGKGGRQ